MTDDYGEDDDAGDDDGNAVIIHDVDYGRMVMTTTMALMITILR